MQEIAQHVVFFDGQCINVKRESKKPVDELYSLIVQLDYPSEEKEKLFDTAINQMMIGDFSFWDFVEILIKSAKMKENWHVNIVKVLKFINSFGKKEEFIKFAMGIITLNQGLTRVEPTLGNNIVDHDLDFLFGIYGLSYEFWLEEPTKYTELMIKMTDKFFNPIVLNHAIWKKALEIIGNDMDNPLPDEQKENLKRAVETYEPFADFDSPFAGIVKGFVGGLCRSFAFSGCSGSNMDDTIEFIMEYAKVFRKNIPKDILHFFVVAIGDKEITNNIHLRGRFLDFICKFVPSNALENRQLFFWAISQYIHELVNYDEGLEHKIPKISAVLMAITIFSKEMSIDDMFLHVIPLYKFLYGILEIISEVKNQIVEFLDAIDELENRLTSMTNDGLAILQEGIGGFGALALGLQIASAMNELETIKNIIGRLLNVVIVSVGILDKFLYEDSHGSGIFKKAIEEAFLKSFIGKSVAIMRMLKRMKYMHPSEVYDMNVFNGNLIVNRSVADLIKGIIVILGYLSDVYGFSDYMRNNVEFGMEEFDGILTDLGNCLDDDDIIGSIEGIKNALTRDDEDLCVDLLVDPLDSCPIITPMWFPHCKEVHSMETVFKAALEERCPYTRNELTLYDVIKFNED